MAIRVVYTLEDKLPDIIQEAKSWRFHDGTLQILNGRFNDGPTRMLIEIRDTFVLSVELVADAEKPAGAPEVPEAPPAKAEAGLNSSQEGQEG
ncbi:hypothetical protein LCGC14_1657150 [marine sediment metagenome]|uniref:Uncharacterized protein n=1 Tax=marine sediment metagenome TaxID=412755 RepID=A0A0F9HVS6_9ZZZZ